MSGAVAVALVVAAVAVLTLPGRRPPPRRMGADPVVDARGRRRWPRRERDPDLARVLLELISRLRSGSDLTAAWHRTVDGRAPTWGPALLAAATGAEPDGPAERGAPQPWLRRRRLRVVGEAGDVAAAVAAFRLAHRLGAPLAQVLDAVVTGVVELREAQGLRRSALAGPRATARLLAWLPLAGIGLGMLLGADPVGVLMGGGAGGAALAAGTTLFVLGHRWVARLVRDAERAAR